MSLDLPVPKIRICDATTDRGAPRVPRRKRPGRVDECRGNPLADRLAFSPGRSGFSARRSAHQVHRIRDHADTTGRALRNVTFVYAGQPG
jgi:hypothetical protein